VIVAGSTEDEWIENRPSAGRRALSLDELWRARELVGFLALRDVKVRYKQAIFGGAWAVVQPLVGAAVFTFVFGRLANVPSDGIPFLVFAFAGFSLWSYFSMALNSARGSLLSNAPLVTKVYFPRLAAPVASVLPGLVDLAVAIVVLGGMLMWRDVTPGLPLLLAPVFLLATVATALGVGTFSAALVVQYRDVQQVFGFVVQAWLFATPVAYPASLVEGGWRWLYHVNPMVGIVEGWRWSLLGAPAPSRHEVLSFVSVLVFLVIGARVFQRTERRFADVI
jgi:lipopolysaccharide transport system permease protein